MGQIMQAVVRAVAMLGLLIACAGRVADAMPSPLLIEPAITPIIRSHELQMAQAAPPPPAAPTTPATAPPPATSTDAEPIGNVVKLEGTASVTRKKDSIALKLKDDIYKNDVLQTGPASVLGITFNDATTFNLTANARIAIDAYVYDDGGKSNAALFNIGRGTVAFVAAAVAKTGDMKITTPTAALGIRGTSGLVEVPSGGAPNNIKLYPDPDGRVGRIEVNGRDGARLGLLTQGASGFAIRPGVGGARFAAVPLQISPQQIARDQGIVRQVHAAQTSGRQIVQQQRALRRANPQRPTPGAPRQQRPNAPGAQPPGQQRPGQPARPGQPNRAGQPGQPGQPQQNPRRPQQGQPAQPGLQQPAAQPRAPGLGRPGLQNRPALQRRAPAPNLRGQKRRKP